MSNVNGHEHDSGQSTTNQDTMEQLSYKKKVGIRDSDQEVRYNLIGRAYHLCTSVSDYLQVAVIPAFRICGHIVL